MGKQAAILCAVILPLAALIAATAWLATGEGHTEDESRPADTARAGPAPVVASQPAVSVPARLTGEVRRAGDRKPVAGQRVVLAGTRPKELECETDERGAFEFAAVAHGGPYEVVVAAPGCAEVRVPGIELKRGEVRDVGTLWLAPAVPVVVEVTTFAGEPIPNATVEAYLVAATSPRFDSQTAPTPVATESTGGDGRATFPGLAVGTWTFVAAKSGFARRGSSEEELHAGDAGRRILLTLERGFHLDGRVLSRAGEPVADASVLVLRRTVTADQANAPLCCRARSDAEGRYAIDSLPGGEVCVWAARPQGRVAIVAALKPAGVAHFDIVLPDPLFVTGHVTDRATGAPVAGAVVEASFQILGAIPTPCEGATDDTGAYRITLPMAGELHSVEATKEGYIRGAASLNGTAMAEGATFVSDLALVRGAALSGTVRGPEGPVGGAWITAWRKDGFSNTTSDREGRYRFDALAAGSALVTAAKAGFQQPDAPPAPIDAMKDGSVPKHLVVEIPAEGAATLDLTMTAAASLLRGLVTTGSVPVEGARVSMDGSDALPVVTAKDGTFRFEHLTPGFNVTVRVRKEGFVPRDETVQVPASPDAPPHTLSLLPFRRVKGRVRSASGAALADAYVQIGNSEEGSPVDDEWARLAAPRRPVRADGSFEIDVEDGRTEGRVHASAAGLAPAFAPFNFTDGSTEQHVELSLGGAHAVSGVVRLTSGAPLAGAWVAVFPRSNAGDTSQESNGAWGPAVAAVADAGGRFTLTDLAPGWWGVKAWSATTLKRTVVVEVPRAEDVVVEVEEALAISGTVVLRDGSPVVGASVEADGANVSGNAVTDARGAFRVGELRAGPCALSVALGDQTKTSFLAKLIEGVAAGTSGLRIEVDPALMLSGTVVFADGTPAAGANLRVAAVREDVALPNRSAGPDGAFEFLGLPPGGCVLHVRLEQDDQQWSHVFDGLSAGDHGVRLQLPARVQVHGLLVDETGHPLAEVTVRATELVGENATQQFDVSTGEDGRFAFWWTDGARYRVQLPDAGDVVLAAEEPFSVARPPARLVAKAGESIAGVVADKDGRPMAGVTVSATASDHTRYATSSEDGAFEIRGLLTGETYTLTGQREDLAPSEAVGATAGRRDVKIVVVVGLEIAGVLVDAAGKPVPSVQLHFQSDSNSQWVQTSGDGLFLLKGLAPQEFRVQAFVQTPRGGRMHDCGTLRAGDRDVTLRLPK